MDRISRPPPPPLHLALPRKQSPPKMPSHLLPRPPTQSSYPPHPLPPTTRSPPHPPRSHDPLKLPLSWHLEALLSSESLRPLPHQHRPRPPIRNPIRSQVYPRLHSSPSLLLPQSLLLPESDGLCSGNSDWDLVGSLTKRCDLSISLLTMMLCKSTSPLRGSGY